MKELANQENLHRIISRLADQISEKNGGVENVALIGILTRGVPVAQRIAEEIKKTEKKDVLVGKLDVTLFRDDLLLKNCKAQAKLTQVDFDVTGKNIVLCDDVIFTGRTVRAAISAIMSLGRAKSIQLLAVADRGHRELPFRADYIGRNIPTSKTEKVCVRFLETDNQEGIYLLEKNEWKNK